MSGKLFGLIELLIFFGGGLALCAHQLWWLRRDRLKRELKEGGKVSTAED